MIPAELEGRLATTVAVAAKVLGVGINAAYAAVKAGEIPSIRIGGRLVIPVRPLLGMLGISEQPEVDQ